MAAIAPEGAFQPVQPQQPATRYVCVFRVGNDRLCLSRTRSSHHWINVHVFQEFWDLAEGRMDLSDACLLTTPLKVHFAALFFVPCPHGCRRYGWPLTFSRRQHLVRHLVNRCIVSVPEHTAKVIAHRCIRVEMRGGLSELGWIVRGF